MSLLEEIETPAAVVDLGRVRANVRRVAGYCREHGLAWRPHVKTHKTPSLAAMQIEAGAIGLTVATLREAEVMAPVTPELLLAYPPVGAAKRRRLARLLDGDVRLSVALDSTEALSCVVGAASDAGRPIGVLVEVDVGMRRVGLVDTRDVVEFSQRVAAAPGVELRGITFYPGHIRAVVGAQDPMLLALAERVSGLVSALNRAGLPPLVVSGGSTPTLWYSHLVAGVTEIRPGTNLFNDRTSVAVGACGPDDLAYTVLATVVSTSVPGQAVIDAGSKALSREEVRGGASGFGALLERPDVTVSALSEEHGILDLSVSAWRPQVGDRVRVVPNHVCVSVNLHERLHVLDGDRPVAVWDVTARGR